MSGSMVPTSLSRSNESGLRALFGTKASSTTRQGLDSGYASAVTTKNNSPELDSSIETNIRSKSFVPQLQRPRTIEQLKLFNLPIAQAVQDRFDDLNELFSDRLIRYLAKERVGLTGISIRLRTLGASEETAVPWVLVQCDKSAGKRVRKFFSQPDVKREYQADATLGLPRLPVYILERPPRALAACDQLSIYGDRLDHLSPTLCGSVISIGDFGNRRAATIGGLIKVQMSEKEFLLYGMTAGHAVVPYEKYAEDSEEELDDDTSSDDDDFETEVEIFEEDDEEYEVGYELDILPPCETEATIDLDFRSDESPKIGCLAHFSRNSMHDRTNTDWALVNLDLPSLYLPNMLTQRGSRAISSATQKDIVLPSASCSKHNNGSKKVRVLGGVSGNQFGILTMSASLVLLAPSKVFIRTHSLVLPGNQALQAGDSGSWVVDADSGVLYGHVVASDASGEVHVMPISDTLQHMEEQLLPECISLPTREDVGLWQAQYSLTTPDIPLVFPIDDHNHLQKLCEEDRSLVHGFELQFHFDESVLAAGASERPKIIERGSSNTHHHLSSSRTHPRYSPPSLHFWDKSSGFHSDSGYSSLQPSPDTLSLDIGHPEIVSVHRFQFMNTLNLLYLQAELVELEQVLKKSIADDLRISETSRESEAETSVPRCESKSENNSTANRLPSVDTSIARDSIRVEELKDPGRRNSNAASNLTNVAGERRKAARDWWYLSNTEHSPTWQIMLTAREKLQGYNKAVLRQTQMNSQLAPNDPDLKFLKSWFSDIKMGDHPLMGDDSTIWESSCASDLITLNLERTKILWPLFSCTKRLDEESRYFEYNDENVLRIANIFSSMVSTTLLIGSTLTLYFVNNDFIRLGVVAIFSMIFSLTLSLVTRAKKFEVFAATAAFLAVQVVFLSSTQKSPEDASS
ncbi:hypothetical protein PVAG01_10864 [Phlyctema vagabunda]|uniref:DUF6594 domain-containing protein n=1 Tax=Phlyctema vagabunda TaxID=108571 RepID=A0ABR4P3G7_9HELO